MNKFFSCAAAGLSAAVLAVSAAAGTLSAWAEDIAEPNTITIVTFDLADDEYYFIDALTTAKLEELFIDTSQTGVFYMPSGTVKKEDYIFYGWTIDGVRGYKSNSVVNFDISKRNIVVKPVLLPTDAPGDDSDRVNVTYDLGTDLTLPKDFPEPYTARTGSFVSTYPYKINDGNAFVSSYSFEDNLYGSSDYLIVPDHDVTFTAVWKHTINLNFIAGDVDRLTGADTFVTTGSEGTSTELSEADRFGRIGFNLTGWLSDYDGKTYLPGQTVSDLPGVDITFTAVWEPKKYTVVFNQGTGRVADNIKVTGYTDTTIVCPDPTILKNNQYFAGWKNTADNKIYQPGEEYFIYGAKPGLGIAFTPVWIDRPVENEPVLGDADLSGAVSVSDIVTILQYSANKEKYPIEKKALEYCDVNFDGDVDAKDAFIVQQIDAKVIDPGTLVNPNA